MCFLFWAAFPLLAMLQATTHEQHTFGRVGHTFLAFGVFLVLCGIPACHIGLLFPLVQESLLQHTDMLVQLVIQLLRTANLTLLLRDLGFHLCPLDIPRVPSPLMIVPFQLQKAHDSCAYVSPAASSMYLGHAAEGRALPWRVYSVPAGALPSPAPFAPPPFMADGDCHAMAGLC